MSEMALQHCVTVLSKALDVGFGNHQDIDKLLCANFEKKSWIPDILDTKFTLGHFTQTSSTSQLTTASPCVTPCLCLQEASKAAHPTAWARHRPRSSSPHLMEKKGRHCTSFFHFRTLTLTFNKADTSNNKALKMAKDMELSEVRTSNYRVTPYTLAREAEARNQNINGEEVENSYSTIHCMHLLKLIIL